MQPNQPFQPGMPYPPPQRAGGFPVWGIVLMILGGLIFVVGIMAVLAISGVRQYLANAKMVEATSSLSTIAKSAVVAYDGATAPEQALCSSASSPVPTSVTMVSGKKYMSTSSDWSVDEAKVGGFACLGFEMTSPQYYQYDYQRTGSAKGNVARDGFHAIAHGDLNGDGVVSTFDYSGLIDPSGKVILAPSIAQTNPTE